MGRSLVDGRSYTLVVSREWRDAQGMPLKEEFRRALQGRRRQMNAAGSSTLAGRSAARGQPRRRWPSTFPEPLDHGLLLRALAIADSRGRRIDGEVRDRSARNALAFTPAAPGAAATTSCRR